MIDQREQALFEQRSRIKAAAKSNYTISIRYGHTIISVVIERKRFETAIDLTEVKSLIYKFLDGGISEGTDFEEAINNLYDVIAVDYPERDIKISILDIPGNIVVERIFNTHQSYQQLAF